VCHLAALTRGRDSFADSLTYYDVNVGGTLNLLMALDAVRETRPPARFVFASTNVVYGSVHVGALSEDMEPHPESPYAWSKLAAEQFVAAYAATGAIGAITVPVQHRRGR
jgi:UDP-glucose 4-epimerase